MFPFFIECSKHYHNEPYKKIFLQKLAFGNGIHIIQRKDKNVLVTENGEFVIPTVYSDKARKDLASKLWQVNDFTRLGDCIEDARRLWSTTKKKDKIYLLYKYAASKPEIADLGNILVLALLLKMIKNADISYDGTQITSVSDVITNPDTYTHLDFKYNRSTPRGALGNDQTTTIATEAEDEDE